MSSVGTAGEQSVGWKIMIWKKNSSALEKDFMGFYFAAEGLIDYHGELNHAYH